MLTDTLPRRRFALLPTPIERLPRLSEQLGVQLYVKRDDQTGLATGGNKTRKLEFLVAEALHDGAQTLITGGAVQSNHCRQTAAAAAKHGLRCVLVLGGHAPPQFDGNNLLAALLGAEIRWTGDASRDEVMEKTYRDELAAGHAPYLITYGGSTPTGAAGYVAAVEELAEQLQRKSALVDHFDTIVFASSSGGTQAGLALGAAALNMDTHVLGISVDEDAAELKAWVAELANDTADRLELTTRLTPDDIDVDDGYLGGGYAVVSDAERDAITLAARAEGLLLDPVYTGRAFAGLLDRIRQGKHREGERILFWHTGGQASLSAFRDVLIDG
jgi:D-cysteine desulfhydrase family pyridoxal phosphate-dependent enzyme